MKKTELEYAEIDGGTLWIMPDGYECHECFLILE